MYFLYSLGGVTFNKCWITLSNLNCYSPNFQGFILMKNALNNQVGMLGDMFLWPVANLKQGVIYFIKQALLPTKSAGSVTTHFHQMSTSNFEFCFLPFFHLFFLQYNLHLFFMPAIFITMERMASSVTPSKQILQNWGTYVFIIINKNYILFI